MTVALDQRPPLELTIEIETAEGATFRLDPEAVKASDVPTAISFSTQRGEGFSTASFTLARDIFRDYPDLNLLDTVRFIGGQEEIVYEGRVQSFPRSSDPQQTITVQCVGWMTYLKNKPMAELIIDRRLGGWTEPSTQRKANVLSEGFRFEGALSSGWEYKGPAGPAVLLSFSTFDATYGEDGEAWFYAGGEDIGSVRFDFARLEGSAVDTSWANFAYLMDDDVATPPFDSSTIFHVANFTNGFAVATAPGRKYAALQINYGGAAVGTIPNTFAFLYARVVGSHELTERGARPEEGYWISDIIQYLLAKYAPKIEWAGEENQYPVQQATWHDAPAKAFDAIQQLNNLSLWEMNIWEERKFYYEPADLTKADWQIRTDDPGVTVNFQGDSIESFANGVVITYSDFFGHTFRLTPDDHPELRDENQNNAASRHGEDLWIEYQIPDECLEDEALQFGRAYLAENNRPKRPGSFTVQGYIKDAGEHERPARNVRNSQTLSVMDDQYEGEPRLIYATSYDDETDTLTITVDAPPQKIEAIVARQQLALEARNLASA